MACTDNNPLPGGQPRREGERWDARENNAAFTAPPVLDICHSIILTRPATNKYWILAHCGNSNSDGGNGWCNADGDGQHNGNAMTSTTATVMEGMMATAMATVVIVGATASAVEGVSAMQLEGALVTATAMFIVMGMAMDGVTAM